MSTRHETPPASRTIKASEFKAKCLKLIDEVADTNVEIVITKNGKPVRSWRRTRRRPNSPSGATGTKS